MNGLKKIFSTAFSILLLSAVLISCGKNNTETSDKAPVSEQTEVAASLEESESDLANVDYTTFYEQLSPTGEWIQVEMDEIKESTAGNLNVGKKDVASFWDILVPPAYADDEGAEVAFVWRPTVAVNNTAWAPYTDGNWVYTKDNGWYFQAQTDPINVTHHYGRWWDSPELGWVWLPGKVWSPAWVTMRESNDMIAWAPVPPTVYLVNNVLDLDDDDINEDHYVLVDKKNFADPQLNKYIYMYKYKENKNKIMIKEMVKLDGPMVVNRTIINRGPDVKVIEAAGTKVKIWDIEHVTNVDKVRRSDDRVVVFNPNFVAVKDKGKNKPVNFVNSVDVKNKRVKMSNDGEYRKGPENSNGNDDNIKNKNDDKSGKRNNGNDVIKFDDKNKNKSNGNNDDKNKSKNDDDKGKGNDKNKDKGKK